MKKWANAVSCQKLKWFQEFRTQTCEVIKQFQSKNRFNNDKHILYDGLLFPYFAKSLSILPFYYITLLEHFLLLFLHDFAVIQT